MMYAFFWVIHQHLKFKCQHVGTLCDIFIGVYENGTECSKPWAFKLQMLVNHPKERINLTAYLIFIIVPFCLFQKPIHFAWLLNITRIFLLHPIKEYEIYNISFIYFLFVFALLMIFFNLILSTEQL
jgi:hypothetical protein